MVMKKELASWNDKKTWLGYPMSRSYRWMIFQPGIGVSHLVVIMFPPKQLKNSLSNLTLHMILEHVESIVIICYWDVGTASGSYSSPEAA